jgi:pyrimidine deaminase RibD-like protein
MEPKGSACGTYMSKSLPVNNSRALFAGMTDYTGIPLEIILSHLEKWRNNSTSTVDTLNRLENQVLACEDRLDFPREILEYISFFRDLFSRYAADFDRLLNELPNGVTSAHVELLQQLYKSAVFEERLCIRFKKEHIERRLKEESLRGLIDRIYAESRDMLIDCKDLSNLAPRLTTFVGTQRRNSPDDADRIFSMMAIDEARKSVPEDTRPHPRVGVVVVKDGKVISKAHRGEKPKCHAEYIALEAKLPDELVAGATVYTTLEPCTARKHPKIPCARRLIERKVARVVIGMLDPNPEIRGMGDQLLSDANIETQLFPRDLRSQVEELNREFIKSQKERQRLADVGGSQ